MSDAAWDASIARDRGAVAARLEELLPPASEEPVSLHAAMRYAVLGGGKRLRALLVMAAHRLFGDPHPRAALDAGCAIECLHAYTLIHDDLPALDDDDLRRGKPTCHRRFGEAVAILAGDALQAFAFEIVARCDAPRDRAAEAVAVLAEAAGSRRLVGGQTADVEGEGKEATEALLRFIHERKTAALIAASLSIGAVLAGATAAARGEIAHAGSDAGLAFQIEDDLLDLLGSEAEAGKGLRKDAERKKITYPAVFGAERSREEARRLMAGAVDRVRGLGDDGSLGRVFALMVDRTS